MSSRKNKNKNRQNKPPNPVPPQKKETVPIVEKKENIVPSDDKVEREEKKVDELVSEVIKPLPALEVIQLEGDVPKKPKRNRGKKKKQDKDDDLDDNIESTTHPELVADVKASNETEECKYLNKQIDNTEDNKVDNVMPTTRKKKNKNKKHNDIPTEEIKEVESMPLNESEKVVTEKKVDEILPPILTESQEQEIKSAKKKNKKKKHRNDSEKSDKSEEVTSCATTFQTLLDTEKIAENKSTDMIDNNKQKPIVHKNIFEPTFTNVEIDIKENIETSVVTTISTDSELRQDIKPEETIKEPKDESNKNKKKNKKDKKLIDKIETMEEVPISFELKTEIAEDKNPLLVSSQVFTENITKDKCATEEAIVSETFMEPMEESSRSKAKIAKPVQKKAKCDIDFVQSLPENVVNPENVTTLIEPLANVVETGNVDKQLTDEKIKSKSDAVGGEEKSVDVSQQTSALESGISKRKERKKSPKLPINLELTTETQESIAKSSKFIQTEISSTKDTEIYSEIPPQEIVSSSLKPVESECEGSVYDTSQGFVEYPRSSSEQFLDDNNNTIISEIFTTDEVKLDVPIEIPETPFIRGIDEISTSPPELLCTSLKEIDTKETKPKEQEKTDLKSKVMEVNQDMEELRLSIEKSLAELTSMETNEKIIEKQHEDKNQFKAQEVKEVKEFQQDISKETESGNNNICTTSIEKNTEFANISEKLIEDVIVTPDPPICPTRKDHKGKGKSKKRGKSENIQCNTAAESKSSDSKDSAQDTKKDEKSEQKYEKQEKGKQQSNNFQDESNQKPTTDKEPQPVYEPIESFEDALTSSVDDVNKTFEMIANESNHATEVSNNPEINIVAPIEDTEKDDNNKKDEETKQNPVSQPKNLLGHPDIPVRSNKTDYKKEKNKTPNTKQAKVKIKDSEQVEIKKQSKESQTENKRKYNDKFIKEVSCIVNDNEEFLYKYSFRRVFLHSACHVCKKDLKTSRLPCNFCDLVFYCNQKHKDEDWPLHQALCFAVSTIVHLKDQKHIYTDAKDVTGHNYRLLRMQMIVSCEKILKRKLVPWEQEALLYPRICADVHCREWRQTKLKDCEGCGQISYCSDHPDHLPTGHQRWCKSYNLYQKLVCYQQTKGKLEPKLPSKVMNDFYQMPDKINEVFASMYEEKIDMSDMEYASLTQLATAPLTAAYCYQVYNNKMNSTYANGVNKKTTFTLHIVGAELQFEADVLNKWETFLLHLRPDIMELKVVFVGPELNPSNLPLELLGNIKSCDSCRENIRRTVFRFQDKMTYRQYWSSDDFIGPDIVCAFNPSIQRSSSYNGKDPWPTTVNTILKLKVPFVVTSYTLNELYRDIGRIKECAEVDYNIIEEPKYNSFASVRPDRNFISDDEIPLLFKNYCYSILCGAF